MCIDRNITPRALADGRRVIVVVMALFLHEFQFIMELFRESSNMINQVGLFLFLILFVAEISVNVVEVGSVSLSNVTDKASWTVKEVRVVRVSAHELFEIVLGLVETRSFG